MRTFRLLLAAIAALSLASADVAAQPGSIVANPDAVRLRLLWSKTSPERNAEVGRSIAALPDINGDGLAEVLIGTWTPNEVRLYLGAPNGVRPDHVWERDYENPASGSSIPNLFGDGRRFLMLVSGGQAIHFYSIDSGRIATTRAMSWPAIENDSLSSRRRLDGAVVADLDRDGDDELICFVSYMKGAPGPYQSQVWIYEGGPGFQLAAPTSVLHDPTLRESDFFGYCVADLDGDGHSDFGMLRRPTVASGNQLALWFGDGAIPTDGEAPDRLVDVTFNQWRVVNVDGDSAADFFTGRSVYHSAGGKSARTRSFQQADADVVLNGSGNLLNFGPMNNRSGRYDMVGLSAGILLSAFSGGPNGPDTTQDAFFDAGYHGFTDGIGLLSLPAGDVNGDGWSDFICSNPFYVERRGVVAILAGGPYIPVDDPSMGVREIATTERPRSLFLWPNPVRDHLNIAWRGDLRRMPSRFEVFDERGVRIADGSVDEFAGGAIWRCGEVAAGTYMLRVLDAAGDVIGTSALSKE
jgi:hypothetical protein